MANFQRSKSIPLTFIVLVLVLLRAASGRSVKALLGAEDSKSVANTCLLHEATCTVNPAISFQKQHGEAQLEDRLYQALMAQHVLCPQQKSEQQCHTETSAYCAWNYQKQRCDTDSYASYLLTLSCPGSKARAYLQCMRKANAAECKADKACTAEHAGSCYPRSMVAAAQMAKVSMQAAAEETAFAIVTGDVQVLGSCAGAQVLHHLAQLCPYSNNWDTCSKTYCTFDMPPFVPRRPQHKPQPTVDNSSNTSSRDRRLQANSPKETGLPYFGADPAPFCAVDVATLPSMLHKLMNVSRSIQATIAAADKQCQAADTVRYSARDKYATCGSSTFSYRPSSISSAAAFLAHAADKPVPKPSQHRNPGHVVAPKPGHDTTTAALQSWKAPCNKQVAGSSSSSSSKNSYSDGRPGGGDTAVAASRQLPVVVKPLMSVMGGAPDGPKQVQDVVPLTPATIGSLSLALGPFKLTIGQLALHLWK